VYRCTLSKPIFAEYLLPLFQAKTAIWMGDTLPLHGEHRSAMNGQNRNDVETTPLYFSNKEVEKNDKGKKFKKTSNTIHPYELSSLG
jgi:hypothetical protein